MDVLASVADIPVGDLRPDVDIFELGLDSLDFWAILMDVEDSAGSEVPADVLNSLAQLDSRLTVGDVLRVVAPWNPRGDRTT